MTATAPLRRLPLSRHPGFAPLIALWLAALVGGCMVVLSEQFALPPLTIASCTAWGGLVGWTAARLVAVAQRRSARPCQARPAAYVERLLVGIDASADRLSAASANPPALDQRHGKAVRLLRQHAPGELAMPLLVERFAVALTDHGRTVAPPAELGFGLYALRNELHRAAPGRTDSHALQGDFAGSDSRAPRE